MLIICNECKPLGFCCQSLTACQSVWAQTKQFCPLNPFIRKKIKQIGPFFKPLSYKPKAIPFYIFCRFDLFFSGAAPACGWVGLCQGSLFARPCRLFRCASKAFGLRLRRPLFHPSAAALRAFAAASPPVKRPIGPKSRECP